MYLGAALAAWWPVRHASKQPYRTSDTAAD